jgi:hypothetical protein
LLPFSFAFIWFLREENRAWILDKWPFLGRPGRFSPAWSEWNTRLAVLLFCLAMVILREPSLMIHPRFWAEEGTGWFQFAASHSFLQSLFYVYPETGYFNLFDNLAAICASRTAAWLGLAYAPAVTTLAGFSAQAAVFVLILFGRSRLFDSLYKSIAGCLLALFAPTVTDEAWLNSTNAAVYLGVVSLLLLFDRPWMWPVWARWLSRLVLVLCALSSPYSVALIPLFFGVAWREKRSEQKIQVIILAVCLIAQAGVAAHSRATGASAWKKRGTDVRLTKELLDVFYHHVVTPALGSPANEALIRTMGIREAEEAASSFVPFAYSDSEPFAAALCFVLTVGILWNLRAPHLFGLQNLLLATFLLLSSFVCVSSLSDVPSGRYAILPGFLFLLLLLENVHHSPSRARAAVCTGVLALTLASGAISYLISGAHMQKGPAWSEQVRLWEGDHRHQLLVWPAWWAEDHGGISYND